MGNFFGTVFSPIGSGIGWLMNLIFEGINAIGIGNVGLAIILITIIIKVAMLPLLMGQLKQAKLSRYMSPELRAIRAKYRGRRDEKSLSAMQAETKALYDKYGVSQTGGCIQLLIQIPILFSLYNVLRNIPTYIGRINGLLTGVLTGSNGNNGIMSDPNFIDTMNNNFGGVDWSNTSTAINALNSFTSDAWNKLADLFPAYSDSIHSTSSTILGMNNFIGLNVTISPNQILGVYILIPIIAAVAQFFSGRLSQQSTGDPSTETTAKIMMFIAPIMTGFIGFTVPTGLGIYWIATSGVQIVMSYFINKHYDKIGAEELIRIASEKKKKKLAKKGIDAETLVNNANISTRHIKRSGSGLSSFKDMNSAASSNQSDTSGRNKNNKNNGNRNNKNNNSSNNSQGNTENTSAETESGSTSGESVTTESKTDNGKKKGQESGSLAAKASLANNNNKKNKK